MNPDNFTDDTNAALVRAKDIARTRAHPALLPVHVLAALFANAESLPVRIAAQVGTASAEHIYGLATDRLGQLGRQDPPPEQVSLSRALTNVLAKATEWQHRRGDAYLPADALLLGLYSDKEAGGILAAAPLAQSKVEAAITEMRKGKKVESKHAEGSMDALNKYCRDLTADAEEGRLDPVVGREEEVRRVIQILSRRTKNNPLLIGEPGTGKTAVVEALAQRVAAKDVPESLHQARVLALDVGALIAGAKYRGEFEERLKDVLSDLAQNPHALLFVDEIHLLMGAGRTDGAMDAANLLKPALARGEIRFVGATTLDEHRKHIEADRAFARRFQVVLVNEPSVENTISILRGIKEKYETHHGVRIVDGALVAAAELAGRYITGRRFPDKAIDLIDEACANTRVQRESRPEQLDILERKRMQLQIEEHALEKESDDASKERLKSVRAQLSAVKAELDPLEQRYAAERQTIDELKRLRERLDQIRAKAESAERRGDLALASDLRYAAIPDIKDRITALEEERKSKDSEAMVSSVVSPDEVAEVVARWTGIPVTRLRKTERERVLQLGQLLAKRVVGQERAVAAVSEAIVRARAGLGRPGQPMGSFLFLGPSGVGKTELSKALAELLFDDEKAMVRIDCGELTESHSVSKLIGSPPGYVGYDQGGQLTEALMHKPHQVILFDELEKAHRDVTHVLLSALDDGFITDSRGRRVDVASSIFVFTSNLGAEVLLDSGSGSGSGSSSGSEAAKAQVMERVRRHFRPEFLNRLDEMVVFDCLSHDQLAKVIDLQLANIEQRLDKAAPGIEMMMTAKAKDLVVHECHQPEYGARPLRRFLERVVVTRLSTMLLQGEIERGSKVVIGADSDGTGLTFRVADGIKKPRL